jgi:hypothetical protein
MLRIMAGAATIVSVLSGCATDSQQQISERDPVIVKTTARSVDKVSGCLQTHFLSFGSDLRVVRGDDQSDLLFAVPQMGSLRYPWKVTIHAIPNGSRVDVRKSDAPFPRLSESEMRAAVVGCAA